MRPNYYKRSKGRYNEVRKARRRANPEKSRAESRHFNRKNRGLIAAYPATTNCEACGRAFTTEKREGPHLDHCHLTGLFRGWLCHRCNTALGMLGDSPEGVSRLLRYIEVAYRRIDDRLQGHDK